MNENDALLAAYSFLAALTENQNDLYNHVYVPICKRALSFYNKNSEKSGKWSDIRDIIHQEYGINVPQTVVKQLINSAYNSLSRNEKNKAKFEIFNHGDSFQIEKYAFMELEDHYRKSIREANALQESFNLYLQTENISVQNIPSIHDFLEKNKRQISSFFGNSEDAVLVEETFFPHLEFFKYIERSNHTLYKIIENQYVGSLVAGFLEAGITLDPKFSSGEIYYLDTSVVLRALDLQKEEEGEATKELLKLITATGGKVNILSITMTELQNVIDSAVECYDRYTPTSTINEACQRLGKNRAWLMNLSTILDKKIKEELNATIDTVLPSFIEKCKRNPDVKDLQATRNRPGNALHDVVAYMRIRELRGGAVFTFQKAKIWFLTTNNELLKFNKKHLINNIPEIIMADSLTSLLWLKNPAKLEKNIKRTGLNVLLAATLDEEIASRELINEFDNALKSIDGISQDDYLSLLGSVAHQSAKQITSFVKLVVSEKDKAKIEAQQIIERERTRRNKELEEKKKYQNELAEKDIQNINLDIRLKEIETKLSDVVEISKRKDEEVRLKYEKSKQNKRYTMWLVISLVVIIIVLIVFIINREFGIFPKFVNWIMSSGGLFGFGSFVINLVKLMKNK